MGPQKKKTIVGLLEFNPLCRNLSLHRKKKVREFPVPSRDVTTKHCLGGNTVITELFRTGGVWLVTSRLETGNS